LRKKIRKWIHYNYIRFSPDWELWWGDRNNTSLHQYNIMTVRSTVYKYIHTTIKIKLLSPHTHICIYSKYILLYSTNFSIITHRVCSRTVLHYCGLYWLLFVFLQSDMTIAKHSSYVDAAMKWWPVSFNTIIYIHYNMKIIRLYLLYTVCTCLLFYYSHRRILHRHEQQYFN